MFDPQRLLARFDPVSGSFPGSPPVVRRLSDLRGCFADPDAYEQALARDNPVIYTVTAFEPGADEGDLHCGIGRLQPGRIGDEYHLTKGHLHAWRHAAEIYLGLAGEGVLLLEDETTGASEMLPLGPSAVVYVPGRTAHRTINTGREPLTYLGFYPARAGHDYAAIARSNFRQIVVERDGRPVLVPRVRA